MDLTKLVQGMENCPCGKPHLCPIEHVAIYSGAVAALTELTEVYRGILLVCDENTYSVQGQEVEGLLKARLTGRVIYPGNTVLVPDEAAIDLLERQVSEKTDLILGVGSGVINDLCKHVSYQKDLPYYIVATAPSMDGYASNGAALILGGMKISPNARPPKAIIGDTRVLKNAPMEMIQAGYGDIMGKLSCLNDWRLSALINGEYLCERVWQLVYDTVLELKPMAKGLLERDEAAIQVLMEALVSVGIAMSYVGNSRPASGSEHHLSHFFEITGIVHGRPYYPHGIDVAYAAILTAGLRQRLLNAQPEERQFDEGRWKEELDRVYGPVAPGVIALQKKLNSYAMFAENVRKTDWKAIRECLAEAPTEAEMRQIIESVGLDYTEFLNFYGPAVLQDAVRFGKDLKDRYSVLWLYDQFGK